MVANTKRFRFGEMEGGRKFVELGFVGEGEDHDFARLVTFYHLYNCNYVVWFENNENCHHRYNL